MKDERTGNQPARLPYLGFFNYTLSKDTGEWLGSIYRSLHLNNMNNIGLITILPNTDYDLSAYVRGEIDADDSAGEWIIRAYFYDSSNNQIGYQDGAGGEAGTITTSWQYEYGMISTPANAAKMRIYLYNYMNSGWVAYDDVALSAEPVGTYNLVYDAENRLTSVSGAVIASFVYDGDGNRVKGTIGGTTTTYSGNSSLPSGQGYSLDDLQLVCYYSN